MTSVLLHSMKKENYKGLVLINYIYKYKFHFLSNAKGLSLKKASSDIPISVINE